MCGYVYIRLGIIRCIDASGGGARGGGSDGATVSNRGSVGIVVQLKGEEYSLTNENRMKKDTIRFFL